MLNWKEYFMGVAELAAQRSKDPVRQVGAVLVKENKIIATGYNGLPNGFEDVKFDWHDKVEKRLYVVHAEVNAILNATTDVSDSVLYVTLYPCSECAKLIVQSGIRKVIYEDKKNNENNFVVEKIFAMSGIKVCKYLH